MDDGVKTHLTDTDIGYMSWESSTVYDIYKLMSDRKPVWMLLLIYIIQKSSIRHRRNIESISDTVWKDFKVWHLIENNTTGVTDNVILKKNIEYLIQTWLRSKFTNLFLIKSFVKN